MKLLCNLPAVPIFFYDYINNLRQKDIILIWTKLLPAQIKPPEHLLFPCCKFYKSHTITAVSAIMTVHTVLITMNPQ